MKCIDCKTREAQKHFNGKYCLPCRKSRAKRPKHNLTDSQIREVKRLLHTMPREEIAKRVGTSTSTLKRWARDNGNVRLSYFNKWVIRPKLVKEIVEYYAEHGAAKTKAKWPKLKIRSVIEHYGKGLCPDTKRWADDQLLILVKSAGLVSMQRQAEYFNRPNAHMGSIKSAWTKKFGHGCMNLNGLSGYVAKGYVTRECPYYSTSFWKRSDNKSRSAVLWVDMEQYLKPEVPDHIKDGIRALANFQRWLHGKRNTKQKIFETWKRVEEGTYE